MGLFFRTTAPPADRRHSGLRGKATVKRVERRFGREVNVRRGKVDGALSGESSPIRKRLTLRVELPGCKPYTVKANVSVPLMKASWVMAGSIVEVLVDPKNPDSLAIDWEADEARAQALAAQQQPEPGSSA